MAMVLVVLLTTRVTAAMVLVDHRVTSSSSDEPAVERERRHEGDRQRERQAPMLGIVRQVGRPNNISPRQN